MVGLFKLKDLLGGENYVGILFYCMIFFFVIFNKMSLMLLLMLFILFKMMGGL